jgi:Flp pilus assembly protein TadD
VERYEDAIPHYRKVLESRPNDAEVLYDLANCYEKLGKSAEAIATYQRYVTAVRASDGAAAGRGEARIRALQGQ